MTGDSVSRRLRRRAAAGGTEGLRQELVVRGREPVTLPTPARLYGPQRPGQLGETPGGREGQHRLVDASERDGGYALDPGSEEILTKPTMTAQGTKSPVLNISALSVITVWGWTRLRPGRESEPLRASGGAQEALARAGVRMLGSDLTGSPDGRVARLRPSSRRAG